METDAARGAPERPSAPLTSARTAPVASTSDPHPEVGTRDAVETMTFPAFPHEPYGIQLELMRSLYATLRRGGIGVFESPTGTGKTLSVLCSALQWLEDERKANARGDTNTNNNSNDAAACDDEPDWLRDFASNKRGRDASDRETRRRARREEARRRAAEADRVFFASRGVNASERGAFGGGRLQKSSTKSKAAAEAAAVAAYAAAVSRGASRDDAIEEAEFLADDWSDETGLAHSKASLKVLRGDDTSSDEDADAKKKNVKRFRRRGLGPLGSSKTGVVDSEDSEDDAPSQQIIFCSRTHSQLTQVVGELRSTAFGKPAGANEEDRLVSAVAVAGRRQLCVNRDALETAGASASRLNERCLELAEEGRKAKGAKDAKGTEKGAPNKKDNTSEKGCPFLRKRRAAVSELAEEALATPMDIEDLAAAGVKRKACPYYAAREAHKRADLIFAPYASLLHAETRESLGIRLSNAVVVFDEAHNLAEAVHGAYGASITGKQIDAVFGMVNAYVERFYSRLSPSNLRHLKTLKALCAAFGKALEDDGRDTSNDKTTPTVVKTLNDFLFDAGADAVNVFALTKYLKESKIAHKIAGYGERARTNTSAADDGASLKNASAREENASKWDWSDDDADVDLGVAAVVRRDTNATRQHKTHQKTPRVGSVHALAAFVSALAAADADGRVLVEKKEKNALDRDLNLDSARSPGGRLKFVLLDAAARFRAVVDQARAVVLVGGTLSPIDELAAQLFPDCAPVRGGSADADTSGYPVAKTSAEPSPSEAENDRNALRAPTRPTFDRKPLFSLSVGHVVPNDALLPLAVGTGPSGMTLDFSFGKRDDEKMIDELGRIVANACAVTPGGAVVFFPSFAYADKVYTRWTHTGLLQRIARLKTVFREPRNAADVETALRSFSDAVARFSVGGDVASSSVSNATATAVYKPSQTGALMLCVCGGKLSEGINFKDALGRLVVMVGLPYANPEEPELKARVAYLDEREGAFFHDARKNKLHERGGFKTRGRRYYEALCMRSVNQSVGRAIRHVGDYAAILLCDRRYVTAPEVSTEVSSNATNEGERDQVEKKNLRGVPAQLAGWIGERLVTPSGYGQTQASLARFFAGKRKNRA